ncbi:Jag family protein [Cellulomonas edaphi]|uniref:R3H domain-containing nucleic acid-binding protein n=1 Tax=Cellulomonas edaphi TaxID=3053468 RepID=A0ABT7S3F7_9CELL|nr:R3H domain-containing nucleic acid-binding protein [Cellulomons edaphi]MDM7830150.1 R3H domain-containing nucleic acid-binding protein [Cellulomons edaphi]
MSTPLPDAPTEPTTSRLEEEGEIAADYLEELLDIADLDGDIDIDIDHGRAALEIVSEDPLDTSLRRLAGRDGEVVDALQELTRLAVQTKTGERSRLMLDVAGYRAGRRAELVTVAEEAIARVRETGAAVALASMNPFERKVVHDTVAAAGLTSDSEGVEPHRHVVIRGA